MWWGDDWTITHFQYALGGIGGVASGIAPLGFGAVGWGIACAMTTIVVSVAGWCEGRNGATFYFTASFRGLPTYSLPTVKGGNILV